MASPTSTWMASTSLVDPMKVTILCPGADASGELAGQGIPACVLTRFLEERRIDVARSGMYTALVRFSVGLDQGRWGAVIEALHEFKRFYDGGVTIGEALPKLAGVHPRYANLSLRTPLRQHACGDHRARDAQPRTRGRPRRSARR